MCGCRPIHFYYYQPSSASRCVRARSRTANIQQRFRINLDYNIQPLNRTHISWCFHSSMSHSDMFIVRAEQQQQKAVQKKKQLVRRTNPMTEMNAIASRECERTKCLYVLWELSNEFFLLAQYSQGHKHTHAPRHSAPSSSYILRKRNCLVLQIHPTRFNTSTASGDFLFKAIWNYTTPRMTSTEEIW